MFTVDSANITDKDYPALLTDRQQEVLLFIERNCAEKGYPPTIQEIAQQFGICANAAKDRLKSLQRAGIIRLSPGIARGIALVKQEKRAQDEKHKQRIRAICDRCGYDKYFLVGEE